MVGSKRGSSSRRRKRRTAHPEPSAQPLAKHDDMPAYWPALGVLALAALALTSYLPAMLWGGFVWDDLSFVTSEPALEDLAGLKRIWYKSHAANPR